jgi:demethylmenaquinone methyltransferase/2-methoxy-6-polyprenyl-1,4-benzoquinol methylase
MNHSSKETFFGFKKVDISEKAKMVSGVFSSVASKYDIMNDAMSFGVHRIWKDRFCDMVPKNCNSVLDVAGGTGDIALRCHKRGVAKVTLCDINSEMLQAGRDKMVDANILNGIEYVQGDAENLPFPDNSFDCYTIAFGIRNVTNIESALRESLRVLKKGGRFLCLEFSKVDNEIAQKAYDFYSFNIIPKIGGFIAGDPGAYQYLAESIRKFPDQAGFVKMIEAAGYDHVSYSNMTCGVVAIHSGYKL